MSNDWTTPHPPNKGAAALRAAMRAHELTWDQTINLLNIERYQLHRWLDSKCRPSLEWAVRIEDELGVDVRLWLQPFDDETSRS